MKRSERHQLKRDELIASLNKLASLIKERSQMFIIGGAAILVIILVIFGVKFFKSQSLKAEGHLLSEVIKLSSDLRKNPENIKKLEELAVKGDSSRLAYVKLGEYFIEKGEFGKAISYLEKATKKKGDLFYAQSMNLIAQVHMEQKAYDEAIETYKKMEKENPEGYSRDIILYHKAEALEKMGNTEEALVIYKQLEKEFPETYFGHDAAGKINELEEIK